MVPIEIILKIFVFLGDASLAKEIPEAFQAIAPHFFRKISIGGSFGSRKENIQTDLVRIYPESGNHVETLTLVTDYSTRNTIAEFLKRFPVERKIKHVQLLYSITEGCQAHLLTLGYESYLIEVLKTSPDLTRLSFLDVQPSSLLISACGDRLTRLDIGFIHPPFQNFEIPITHRLEVLCFTPNAARYFIGSPPLTLRVLIIHAKQASDSFPTQECIRFVRSCTSVTNVAVIDACMFFYIFTIRHLRFL